ncbi:unnamed protein product [Adineta steineri]|uniref:Peptidase C1A papain C-terminal domain-containing protein n=1 Tax=Adineta steineri TaxID=433720 RepID=A0A819J3Q8_9BILA|nr:unnamed protein product [Adineta steineri]CAF3926911.1 unnamed protein product [Adineta steineri]
MHPRRYLPKSSSTIKSKSTSNVKSLSTSVAKSKSHQSFDSTETFATTLLTDNAAFSTLPRQIDLRRWMAPIVSQDLMNTCAASAFASACEYLIKRRTGSYVQLSRLFIHFNAQVIDQRTHTVEDAGATRKNVIVGMRKFGVCKEEYWPYDRRLLNKKPSPDAYEAARRFSIVSLRLPFQINAMRTYLANKIPVVIAAKIKYEINGEVNANGGYLPIPDADDEEISYLGSHAVLLVGYDDDSEYFIARNSWGRDWGYYGYCFLPYQYLLDERLVNYPDYAYAITHVVARMDFLPPMRSLGVTSYPVDGQRRRARNRARSKSRATHAVSKYK